MKRVRRISKPEPMVLRKVQVARLLNTTIWTVDRWVRRNQFPKPFFVVPGAPAMWDRRDVEAFILKRKASRRPKAPLRGQLKQFAQDDQGAKS